MDVIQKIIEKSQKSELGVKVESSVFSAIINQLIRFLNGFQGRIMFQRYQDVPSNEMQ